MRRTLVPLACTFIVFAWSTVACSDSPTAQSQAPAPNSVAADASIRLPEPERTVSSPKLPRTASLRPAAPEAEAMQHLNAGLRAWRQGREDQAIDDCEEAIKIFTDAIQLDPYASFNFANRARAHTVLGEDDLALQDLAQAAALGFNRIHLEVEIAMLKMQRLN